MDPAHAAIVAAKLILGPKVREWIRSLPDPNTPKFREARDELFRQWFVEFVVQVQEQYAYLHARNDDVDARIAELENDAEAGRVHANYARAADTEPTDERRRMLDFAAAALIDSRLTVAQHSRVERLIRELDPSDVLTLSTIDRAAGTFFEGTQTNSEARVRWELWNKAGADILAASACVRITHETHRIPPPDGQTPRSWDLASVTHEGRLVLHVLRLYIRARQSPFEIPGHEPRQGDCSEADAWKVIDGVPVLRSAAIRLSAHGNARYDYPKPDYRNGTPGPHNGQGTLRIREVPGEDAEAVAAGSPPPGGWVNRPGMPIDKMMIEAPPSDAGTPGKRVLQVYGPHDVLRWLADEVDARWT